MRVVDKRREDEGFERFYRGLGEEGVEERDLCWCRGGEQRGVEVEIIE